MHSLYSTLAEWWPLFSPPADYADEAGYFLPLIVEHLRGRPATLLELGSGGGNTASHLKAAFTAVTLVDLSPGMLEVSRRLNPDCEHLEGDMRSVRLGRIFDVVFIHDAIDYMTTLGDLRSAITTAAIHCAPGGLVLLAPDHVRETFKPYTDHGGEDGEGRSIRYLEWTYDPDPNDHTSVSEFVILHREAGRDTVVEHDTHVFGLFPRADWLRLLAEAGLEATWHIDPFERCIFIARKP